MNNFNQNPYPLLSFPPRIYAAAMETLKIVQTTNVIAATSILTALSNSVGCNADWKHPGTGQIRPSTLYLWVVALSGERKTTTDALVCGPIYAHDEAAILKHSEDVRAYKADRTRWSSINKGLLSRIAKLSRAGESTVEVEAEFEAHAAQEPVQPHLHRLIRQDISHRSVYEALEGDSKSIALMTDEGQILLDSNIMRHIGTLNKIWDGSRVLTQDRADNDNLIVLNPRATISIMVQPTVLNQFLAKHGTVTHGSGHWARYLIARSPSIQGFRPPNCESTLTDLLPFHARMTELLRAYHEKAKAGAITRDVLEFDDAAKQQWFQIASNVEGNIQPGYYLSDIGDFASKYMDIVGRIATLMHYFEATTDCLPADPQVRAAQIGKISADTLGRAASIAEWHLHEYKQVFSQSLPRTPEELDADRVYTYLHRTYHARNVGEVAKNLVRQFCGVRGHGRFDNALQVLRTRLAIHTKFTNIANKKKPTEIIGLNYPYFSMNPIF